VKIIKTHEVTPNLLDPMEQEFVYNAMDCMITREVYDVIEPQLTNQTRSTYEFSKALQGPVLEMRLRGCLVDTARRADVIDEMFNVLDTLETHLSRIVLDGVGMEGFNWRSHQQRQRLFYDILGISPIIKSGRRTTDRSALEKLYAYLVARPVVNFLMAMDDLDGKIAVLRTELDPDKRIRTSYNIAGTSTGRFSSSLSEFGTGGNLQNVEESLRSIFIADPGMKMAKFDAKSGESYVVGAILWNLFADSTYLDAVDSGDVHTAVARIVWPNLGWTSNLKRDKDIAETPFYRHHSYRFMCKKLGHGSNYGGKPGTLSDQTKLPLTVVSGFQPKYFRAFPRLLDWHEWVDNQLRRHGYLTTLTGRHRWFLGRRSDDSTLREAIAYDPQGSLADIVNTAMLNLWRARTATLLFQDHDALTFQYPEALEDEIIPKLISGLRVPIELNNGRTLLIPFDAKCGWNKGDYNEKTNPDGLKDWSPGDKRKRHPQVGILGRPLRGI